MSKTTTNKNIMRWRRPPTNLKSGQQHYGSNLNQRTYGQLISWHAIVCFCHQTFYWLKRLNTSSVSRIAPAGGSKQVAGQEGGVNASRTWPAQPPKTLIKGADAGPLWRPAARVASRRETSLPASDISGCPSTVTPFCLDVIPGRRMGRSGTWGMTGVLIRT